MRLKSSFSLRPLFFFCFSIGVVSFVLSEKKISQEILALFVWIGVFLSFFFSFEGVAHLSEREEIERWWLVPLHPWQMILRLMSQHILGFGLPLGIVLEAVMYLLPLSGAAHNGLIIGFIMVLPALSLLGILLNIVSQGSSGGQLFQACLLFPFALPLLLLGWGVVACYLKGQDPLPCILGMLGLWCIQGCFTFFFGSWALKQRVLT